MLKRRIDVNMTTWQVHRIEFPNITNMTMWRRMTQDDTGKEERDEIGSRFWIQVHKAKDEKNLVFLGWH